MVSAALFESRQGPRGLPAVLSASSRPTPRRCSSSKRVRPCFHWVQTMARNRRLIHSSSLRKSPASGPDTGLVISLRCNAHLAGKKLLPMVLKFLVQLIGNARGPPARAVRRQRTLVECLTMPRGSSAANSTGTRRANARYHSDG